MLGFLSRIRLLIFITIAPQISTLGADSPSGVQPRLFLWLLLLLLILDRTIFSLYNSYRVQDLYWFYFVNPNLSGNYILYEEFKNLWILCFTCS